MPVKKRILSVLASGALMVGLGAVAPATASAAPYCGIRWGSPPSDHRHHLGPGREPPRPAATTASTGSSWTWNGTVTGYSVSYVSRVEQLGSGQVVLPGRGGPAGPVEAAAYDVRGEATYSPRTPSRAVDVTGYRTFRQVATGSFEGQTPIGLGVRARPRCTVLDGPGDGSRSGHRRRPSVVSAGSSLAPSASLRAGVPVLGAPAPCVRPLSGSAGAPRHPQRRRGAALDAELLVEVDEVGPPSTRR